VDFSGLHFSLQRVLFWCCDIVFFYIYPAVAKDMREILRLWFEVCKNWVKKAFVKFGWFVSPKEMQIFVFRLALREFFQWRGYLELQKMYQKSLLYRGGYLYWKSTDICWLLSAPDFTGLSKGDTHHVCRLYNDLHDGYKYRCECLARTSREETR